MIGIGFFMSSVAVNRYLLTTQQGAAVYSAVLVDLTNKARAENNTPTLTLSDTLTQAAQMKANDMASKQYFAHTSPDGTTPWYWFQKAGYGFMYAGENLAVDFSESSDVENAWLASPKHRENIVDNRFSEIGIATKTAMWQGRETTFVVQLFGTPSYTTKNSAPMASVVLAPQTPSGTIKAVPEVAGVSKSQNTPPSIAVLSETPDTIVVANTTTQAPNNSLVHDVTQSLGSQRASLLDKTIVRMPNISSYALVSLAVIILLGLILFIFIEIKRQHPRHVVMGIFVFFLLSSLAYLSQSFVLPI